MITLQIITKSFYIFRFDLTPDTEDDKDHISLSRQGNVHIETRLNKPLPEPVT